MANVDFLVSDQGTICCFTPMSEAGLAASRDGTIAVQSWQWMGCSFFVDHRCAEDLIDALRSDGFEVKLED